jgi:CRP-like cAMP-binding protein
MSDAKHAQATNGVLRALSLRQNQRLRAHSQHVNLVYGDVLCEPGKPIRHVYFPNNGIISLLTPVDGHASVEVGLVGKEGMAGMGLFLGISVSPVRMLVQGSGTAMRMQAVPFRNELKRNPALQRELSRYLYAFMAQVSQTAACNRHHLLGQRLARWLLMTQDRAQSNEFHLTQEFLAHMLGVRRVGVSEAARLLQEKGLISYRRGNITVLDRKGLERASCRCYRDVNNIRDRMLRGAEDHSPY